MDAKIEEGNKMIAEFMGAEMPASSKDADGNIRSCSLVYKGVRVDYIGNSGYGEFKFHSSWDWLMPVVEKIQSIDITPAPNYSGYRIEIVVQGYVKITGFPMTGIFTNVSVEGSLIKAVWLAVIKFIQWYNNKTQITNNQSPLK